MFGIIGIRFESESIPDSQLFTLPYLRQAAVTLELERFSPMNPSCRPDICIGQDCLFFQLKGYSELWVQLLTFPDNRFWAGYRFTLEQALDGMGNTVLHIGQRYGFG